MPEARNSRLTEENQKKQPVKQALKERYKVT